jgi:putative membrane protein
MGSAPPEPDPPPRRPRTKVRTHLANERTFLAWARTGLTCMALGMGAAQLLDDTTLGSVSLDTALALSLVLFGFMLVVIGRIRYRQTGMGLRTGEYTTHRHMLEVVVIGAALITAIAVLFVLQSR